MARYLGREEWISGTILPGLFGPGQEVQELSMILNIEKPQPLLSRRLLKAFFPRTEISFPDPQGECRSSTDGLLECSGDKRSKSGFMRRKPDIP
jgi:hypothetical protein